MINFNLVIENDFEEPLYRSKVNEVINYLDIFGSHKFFDIVRNVGGSERRMLRLLDLMVKDNMISFDCDSSCFKTNNDTIFNSMIRDVVDTSNLDNVRETLTSIWAKKPIPTLFFDQRPVTMETTLKRVAYLMSKGDVQNKKVVFLGDDDLTSIALALASKSSKIVALDVDERLVDFINSISKEYNLNVEAYVYNVMDNKTLFDYKFDTLMTDPTPEVIPFTLFMNNAINLVKEDGVIYTSIYSSAMDKTINLQNVMSDMQLYISDVISKFTEYQAIYELYKESDILLLEKYHVPYNEDSICFTETLFRLEKTNNTKTLPLKYKGSDIFGKATKRAISNKDKDVAESSSYLNKVSDDMNKISNQEFTF